MKKMLQAKIIRRLKRQKSIKNKKIDRNSNFWRPLSHSSRKLQGKSSYRQKLTKKKTKNRRKNRKKLNKKNKGRKKIKRKVNKNHWKRLITSNRRKMSKNQIPNKKIKMSTKNRL